MNNLSFNNPIFIIPLQRMGGTLLNTIFDAHPDICMSYEIYQEKLFDNYKQPYAIDEVLDSIRAAFCSDTLKWTKAIQLKGFRSFVACARRGDIEVDELFEILKEYQKSGGNFNDIDGRLSFIDRLMIYKMEKFGGRYWGGKAKVSPWILYERYPKAFFFAMVRDGRDSMASQLEIGTFGLSPSEIAIKWREYILEFKRFSSQPSINAQFIKYEDLVQKPESVIKNLCSFIGTDYSSEMLSFHKKNLALFRNPHGHLSHKQIAKGINTQSLGRWRHDLSKENAEIFLQVNSDLLKEFNYHI